jgi:hypothetical protein
MAGDDRTRHCDLCELNVHNISGMTAVEVERLVAGSEGRLCIRMFRRADGTVITRDCPVGLRAYRKRAAGLATAAMATVLSFLSVSYGQDERDVKRVDASKARIVRTAGNIGHGSAITGSVVDSNGAVIPNSKILLYRGENELTSTISDDDGRFTIERLDAGSYEIRIPASGGFRELVISELELSANENQEITIDLDIDPDVALMGITVTASFEIFDNIPTAPSLPAVQPRPVQIIRKKKP